MPSFSNNSRILEGLYILISFRLPMR